MGCVSETSDQVKKERDHVHRRAFYYGDRIEAFLLIEKIIEFVFHKMCLLELCKCSRRQQRIRVIAQLIIRHNQSLITRLYLCSSEK